MVSEIVSERRIGFAQHFSGIDGFEALPSIQVS